MNDDDGWHLVRLFFICVAAIIAIIVGISFLIGVISP